MNYRDLLLGIAIGDAFGAGVEFQERAWIRANVDFTQFVNARHLIDVPDAQKALFTENYRPWDYTDDTEMTIGVVKALMDERPFFEALLVEKWTTEYQNGIQEKGYGRNGHGSMRWFFSGEKTIEELRDFQRNRPNPGNAPAMRAVPLGLVAPDKINAYAAINAQATHPNIHAILSSQCIARAAEYLLIKKGAPQNIIPYCLQNIPFNQAYQDYLCQVDELDVYEKLSSADFEILLGPQPIQEPYFLAGIHGLPSDSKYTAGAVLYILKQAKNTFDALKKSIYLGGDVDSVASIATGIMGAIHGLDALPQFMLAAVEGKAYLEALAIQWEQSC